MSAENQNNIDSQEIDLAEISQKITKFFENIQIRIFKGILFLKRNFLTIALLFIIGAGLGFYLDSSRKIYDSEIIVSPNFNSVDYLYSKIDLIKTKIKDNDSVFLRKIIGLKDPKEIKNIKISPIIDVYRFVNDNDKNFELMELLAKEGDLNSIIKEKTTSKNYAFHMITVTTRKETSYKAIVAPLLNYLNQSNYFNLVKSENVKNVKYRIAEVDTLVRQTNNILNAFYDKMNRGQNDRLMYYNENTELSEVIKTENKLIEEKGELQLKLVDFDKVIKDKSITLNIRNTESINGKLKIILPFAFIFLFLMGSYFISYYKTQIKKQGIKI